MFSALIALLSFAAVCLAQTTIGPSQVAAAVTSKDALQSLEDMGISVLSEILSSSVAIVIETENPSATSSASSTLATSASSASSAALTSNDAKTGPTATGSVTSSTSHAATTSSTHSDRNLVIILGTLLGILILALLVTALWLCYRRRKHNVWGRRTGTPVDDDEISSWRRPVSQRQTMEETTISQPAPPYQPGVERPHSGAYAPIPHPYQQEANQNPFEDEAYNTTHRGGDLGISNFNNSSSSSEPLRERSPTPFFGASSEPRNLADTSYNGGAAAMDGNAAPYNGVVVSRRPIPTDATLHKGNRQSTAADPGYTDATTYNGNGPWVPPAPARGPRRPRSLPRSPLGKDNGFDFGFEEQPMRHSLNGRYSAEPAPTRGMGVISPIGEAHQRF